MIMLFCNYSVLFCSIICSSVVYLCCFCVTQDCFVLVEN